MLMRKNCIQRAQAFLLALVLTCSFGSPGGHGGGGDPS